MSTEPLWTQAEWGLRMTTVFSIVEGCPNQPIRTWRSAKSSTGCTNTSVGLPMKLSRQWTIPAR